MRFLVRFVLSVWVFGLMVAGAFFGMREIGPMTTATGVIITIFFVLPSAWLALGLALKGVPLLLDLVWPVERKPSPMPPDIAG